jgi:hypothetical protein
MSANRLLVRRARTWLRLLDYTDDEGRWPCKYGHAGCSDCDRGLCSDEAAGVIVDLIGPPDESDDYFLRGEEAARKLVASADNPTKDVT